MHSEYRSMVFMPSCARIHTTDPHAVFNSRRPDDDILECLQRSVIFDCSFDEGAFPLQASGFGLTKGRRTRSIKQEIRTNRPGVYVINLVALSSDRLVETLYVGQSKNVGNRLNHHMSEGFYTRISRIRDKRIRISVIWRDNRPQRELLHLEALLIGIFNPRYNFTRSANMEFFSELKARDAQSSAHLSQ